MDLLLSKLLDSVVQIAIFSAIPVLWWLVINKRKENIFKWIGLKKVEIFNFKVVLYIAIGVIGILSIGILLLHLTRDMETATSEFAGLGYKGLPAAMIFAFLGTGLPEEIFFRGFLLKRISNKFGLLAGILIQGILFGLIHGILFISIMGIIKTLMIIIFTGTVGCFIGYVNEKKAQGSIIVSWIIHGLANTFSSIISLFLLI